MMTKKQKKIKFLLQVALPLNIRRKICEFLFKKYVSKNEKIFQKDLYDIKSFKDFEAKWYANRRSWLSPFKNESTK